MLEFILQQENRAVTAIYSRYWRPRKINGSSTTKAQLAIRVYFRLFLLSLSLFVIAVICKSEFNNEFRNFNDSILKQFLFTKNRHLNI